MSRRATLPANNVSEKVLVSIPVFLVPDPGKGIIVQVRKVSDEVKELQKNMTVESAARNYLQMRVKNLITENAATIRQVQKVSADVCELQKNMAAAKNDLQICVSKLADENAEPRDPNDGHGSLHLFMRIFPCHSLTELNGFLAHIDENELNCSQWIEYIKLLGGNEYASALKIIINTIMDRSVQKQLSLDGFRSKKPSMKFAYKGILNGIHIAMKDKFKDYTFALGEEKIKSLLQNAAK